MNKNTNANAKVSVAVSICSSQKKQTIIDLYSLYNFLIPFQIYIHSLSYFNTHLTILFLEYYSLILCLYSYGKPTKSMSSIEQKKAAQNSISCQLLYSIWRCLVHVICSSLFHKVLDKIYFLHRKYIIMLVLPHLYL